MTAWVTPDCPTCGKPMDATVEWMTPKCPVHGTQERQEMESRLDAAEQRVLRAEAKLAAAERVVEAARWLINDVAGYAEHSEWCPRSDCTCGFTAVSHRVASFIAGQYDAELERLHRR